MTDYGLQVPHGITRRVEFASCGVASPGELSSLHAESGITRRTEFTMRGVASLGELSLLRTKCMTSPGYQTQQMDRKIGRPLMPARARRIISGW
ncbi:hypothetical protein ACLB2K_016973 [Fragaria x ananassa]